MTDSTGSRMPLVAALEVLIRLRTDQIVVTTMGSAREWPKLSQHPLDFHYVPSSMGQAPPLGLGLALAKPEREVLVLNGDGGMLMNLGCLVTIVASGVRNITVIVLENGIYEVTGGQQTAALAARQHAEVDFAGFASAAGFAVAERFNQLQDWQAQAAEILRRPGPRFVALSIEPVGAEYHLEAPGPMAERLPKFAQALAQI